MPSTRRHVVGDRPHTPAQAAAVNSQSRSPVLGEGDYLTLRLGFSRSPWHDDGDTLADQTRVPVPAVDNLSRSFPVPPTLSA